jgi:hypothetical protein
MPEDDNLDRKVRKLAVEHAETRWLALRLDDDVKELHDELRAVHNTLQEHTARFDSVDLQLRSLTQMVSQVLERLPEQLDGGLTFIRPYYPAAVEVGTWPAAQVLPPMPRPLRAGVRRWSGRPRPWRRSSG